MECLQPFRVAEFRIDPTRNVISGPSGETAVEPKIMEVLCALAERPGHVFSRAELVDLVWGHAYGADESLTRAISQLRKVFGDSRDDARVLETIQKRGYRLIAPVSSEAADAASAAPAPENEAARPKPVWLWITIAACFLVAVAGLIAWRLLSAGHAPALASSNAARPAEPGGISVVLSGFTSGRDQADSALLAQSLREGLITNMSRTSLLHLETDMPRANGPLRYRVEGSVQKADGVMRVNVQLLRDGEHVWAANFDRPAGEPLAVQDEFISAITAELIPRIWNAAKAELRTRDFTTLLPWELVLLATGIPGSDEVFLKPHSPDAFWLQRRALALDPNFAPAHASLASGLAYHALFNPPENTDAALVEAARHAQIAIALAPYAPDVLYQLANYHRFRGDREQSAGMLRRILEIHPDDIQAGIDLPFVEGQCSPASAGAITRLLTIEQGLSPANPMRRVVLSHLADIYLSEGRFDRARDAAAGSRAIVQSAWSGITLAAALAQLGEAKEAHRISAETRREWPKLDYGVFANRTLPLWCLGGARTEAARSAFLALDRVDGQNGAALAGSQKMQ